MFLPEFDIQIQTVRSSSVREPEAYRPSRTWSSGGRNVSGKAISRNKMPSKLNSGVRLLMATERPQREQFAL